MNKFLNLAKPRPANKNLFVLVFFSKPSVLEHISPWLKRVEIKDLTAFNKQQAHGKRKIPQCGNIFEAQLFCALFRRNRPAFAAITPANLVSVERLGSSQFIKVPHQSTENTHV